MSPDQAMGQEFDARSEVYSIGCVIFEALTGALPFKGNTPLDTLAQQTSRQPPKLKDIAKVEFPT
jgi:eukaryotic-like serine/threonine-protein kinase